MRASHALTNLVTQKHSQRPCCCFWEAAPGLGPGDWPTRGGQARAGPGLGAVCTVLGAQPGPPYQPQSCPRAAVTLASPWAQLTRPITDTGSSSPAAHGRLSATPSCPVLSSTGPKMVAVQNYHGNPAPPGKPVLTFQTGDVIELLRGDPESQWWEVGPGPERWRPQLPDPAPGRDTGCVPRQGWGWREEGREQGLGSSGRLLLPGRECRVP